MFTKTQKLVLGIGLAINIAGVATIGLVMHDRYVDSHTIELSKVVVTPADVEGGSLASNGTIEMILPAVVVTPANAETVYAANDAGTDEQAAGLSAIDDVVQAMAALSPGEYLDSSVAVSTLSTLAFERIDR